MELLRKTVRNITDIDRSGPEKVRRRLAALSGPPDALGELATLVAGYVGLTGPENPAVPRKAVVLMAADHGVAARGVSAYPPETTGQMVSNYLAGGAAANVLARHAGADLFIVDIGLRTDLRPDSRLINRKIAYGSEDFSRGPAMSRANAVRAVEAGIEIAGRCADRGYGLLALAEMGIGNTTAGAAIAVVYGDLPPEKAVGRGTGIGDRRLQVKIEAVRRGIALNQPAKNDALDVLSKVGGYDIAGLAGVIMGAAARRLPTVVDGPVSAAAALIAAGLQPRVRQYLIGSHLSVEPAHAKMLDLLKLTPILDMDMRLGEGSGALLAMTMLAAGLTLYKEMTASPEAAIFSLPHYPVASKLISQAGSVEGESYAADGSRTDPAAVINETIARITPPDGRVMAVVQRRLDSLTKPAGSLGALEQMARQLAGVTGQVRPERPRKAVIVTAGQGPETGGAGRYPPPALESSAGQPVGGDVALRILARHTRTRVVVIDLGTAAGSRAPMIQALAAGIDAANDLIDQGIQVIGLGNLGPVSHPAGWTVAGGLTGRPPAELAAMVTGRDRAGERQLAAAVFSKARPAAGEVIDVLAQAGSPEIAALTGVVLAGAARRVLVVLDGFISSVAALAAVKLSGQVTPYLLSSHLSAEPGHRLVLGVLGLKPGLRLNMRREDGSGAVLGMTLLDAGLKILNEMATFAEAKVARRLTD